MLRDRHFYIQIAITMVSVIAFIVTLCGVSTISCNSVSLHLKSGGVVNLTAVKTQEIYARHINYSVGDEASQYVLSVSGFDPLSSAGDSLMVGVQPAHCVANGMKFSTMDNDNDKSGSNCADTNARGAWWYNACVGANYGYVW